MATTFEKFVRVQTDGIDPVDLHPCLAETQDVKAWDAVQAAWKQLEMDGDMSAMVEAYSRYYHEEDGVTLGILQGPRGRFVPDWLKQRFENRRADRAVISLGIRYGYEGRFDDETGWPEATSRSVFVSVADYNTPHIYMADERAVVIDLDGAGEADSYPGYEGSFENRLQYAILHAGRLPDSRTDYLGDDVPDDRQKYRHVYWDTEESDVLLAGSRGVVRQVLWAKSPGYYLEAEL